MRYLLNLGFLALIMAGVPFTPTASASPAVGFAGAMEKIEAFLSRTDEGRPKLGFLTSLGLPAKFYAGLEVGYHLTDNVRVRGGLSFISDRPSLREYAFQVGAQFLPLPKLWIVPTIGLHYAAALGSTGFYADRTSLPASGGKGQVHRHNVAASFGVDFVPYAQLNLSGGYVCSLVDSDLNGVFLELGYYFDPAVL